MVSSFGLISAVVCLVHGVVTTELDVRWQMIVVGDNAVGDDLIRILLVHLIDR